MTLKKISFAIASSSPKSLADFYGFALNARVIKGLSPQHWLVLAKDELLIQIYRTSQPREMIKKKQTTSICIELESSIDPFRDIEEFCSLLKTRGAVLIEDVRKEFFGVEVTLSDPEGNQFLIVSYSK